MQPAEIFLFLLIYLVPIAIMWFVIKTAVIAALRQYDRERAGGRP